MTEKRINVMRIVHENPNTCSQVIGLPRIYVEIGMVIWVSDAGNIKVKWSEN